MKPIILLILHLPPPIHGAAMMGKYIHDSQLINESFNCHYINLTTATNLTDIGKMSIRKLIQFIQLLHTICKEVKRLKPQLVYITPNAKGGAFYKDFIIVQMLKTMGCQIVAHYHNKGVSTRQDHWLDDKLYRLFFKRLKVILLAEALYADIKKYVKREDVMFCPNGIPETLNKESTAERNNKVPHLLFLSNLLESKGVLVLLDALKLLSDKGYSFVCDFVGGETTEIDAARFKREVEQRGLNKLAIYDGKKFGEEKKQYFEQADIFVLPTHNECFPLVNLEAMEYKLPVISTNEGGIPDVVKDGKTGFICEKKDADLLAHCIEQLFTDKELRLKMGEEGYKAFKQHFTLQAFESTFISCVNKCKHGGGGNIYRGVLSGQTFWDRQRRFF